MFIGLCLNASKQFMMRGIFWFAEKIPSPWNKPSNFQPTLGQCKTGQAGMKGTADTTIWSNERFGLLRVIELGRLPFSSFYRFAICAYLLKSWIVFFERMSHIWTLFKYQTQYKRYIDMLVNPCSCDGIQEKPHMIKALDPSCITSLL